MPSDALIEGRDFTIDVLGRYVFTEYFLLHRGYCCGSGCRHCPYDESGQPRPEARARHPELADHCDGVIQSAVSSEATHSHLTADEADGQPQGDNAG